MKIKDWIVIILCLSLLAGGLAIFSIGDDEDDDIKKNDIVDTDNVDSDNVESGDGSELPDETPQYASVYVCNCDICTTYGKYVYINEGFDNYGENEVSYVNIPVGTEISIYVPSADVYVSYEGIGGEQSHALSGVYIANVTVSRDIYVWASGCQIASEASQASMMSFNMRRPETTATNLNADAGEQMGDEGWTPFY